MRHAIRFIATITFLLTAILSPAQTADWKYMHQGNKSFGKQDYAAAEQAYRKALQANPKNSRASFNLGDTYLAQNNAEEAMKMYQQAAKGEENKVIKAMAFHNMGYIYHKNKQYKEAIDYYKEALRNNPRDNDTRYNLALCQKQKNEQEEQKQQNQQQDQQQQEQEQQEQEQKNDKQEDQKQEMSKENAEQLLNLSQRAEQETREKLNRQPSPRKKTLEKNW